MEKKEKKEGNSERWLLTYSDLITLLLALFIILFAMSNIDKEKYADLASSANKALGSGSENFQVIEGSGGILDNSGEAIVDSSETTTATPQESTTETTPETTTNEILSNLANSINSTTFENNLSDGVTVSLDGNTLTITLSNQAHFDSASAEINDYMKKVLTLLASELQTIDSTIIVRGYTDNVPTTGTNYTSNWQLSAMRSANVSQYLIDECHINSTRLVAVGCGENYPKASNDTEEGRSKNRRIELSVTYNK